MTVSADAYERVLREASEASGVTGLPALGPLVAVFEHLGAEKDPEPAVEALIAAVDDPELGPGVRAYVAGLATNARTWGALADLGMLPSHGLFAELSERLIAKVLPSLRPLHDLTEILREATPSHGSATWMDRVGDDTLARLCRALVGDAPAVRAALALGTLRAATLLSHRLAAAGEEPHFAPYTEGEHESPFLAQADEVVRLAQAWRREGAGEVRDVGDLDPAHALVLLAQCESEMRRVRRMVPQRGATIRLTYELERMTDLTARLRLLLTALSPDLEVAWPARAAVLRKLVRARLETEPVLPVVQRGLHLVAAEIVSHAGRVGGHYITRTATDYARIWRAAAGAGALVALAAILKVLVTSLHAAPLIQAGLYSLNYAVCFVVVQLLGFTIATKQPSMTAATLARAVEADQTEEEPLVDTVIRLARSQLAAILGNVLVAFPAAFLGSTLASLVTGHPVADVHQAEHLAEGLHPFESGALFHAAIAGLWLSLAGVVAGYVSNSVIARHFRERATRSRPLRRWLGEERVARGAAWLEGRAGALTGSVVLGVLLGSTSTVGAALGLPLDIRHVSFASASLGLAVHTLGVDGVQLGWSILGVWLIGLINLSVSFGLSLALAFRARGLGVTALPALLKELGQAFWRDFPAWFVPVGRTARAMDEAPPPPGVRARSPA